MTRQRVFIVLVLCMAVTALIVALWTARPAAQVFTGGVSTATTALENLTGNGTENPSLYTTHWWLQQIETAIESISLNGPAESSVFADGAALTPIGLERRDTPGPGTSVINGDIGTPGMSAYGGVYTQLLTDAGAIATFATDGTHGQSVVTTGPQAMLEAKNFDGAALPNTVTEGQSGRAAGTLSGIQYVMNVSQSGIYDYSGPSTCNSSLSTAAVLETEIKATTGILTGFNVQHIDATPVVCRLYNDTAANTDESDTPLQRFIIPANATSTLGSGTINLMPPGGMNFSTAITTRCTTGLADNNTGALSATEVVVNYCYK